MYPNAMPPGLLQMMMGQGGQMGGGAPPMGGAPGGMPGYPPGAPPDRSGQVARGNAPAPNAMMAPGPTGGPGPDPRLPSAPSQNYDPTVMPNRPVRPLMRPMLGRPGMGGGMAPGGMGGGGLQIGNRSY